MKLLYDFSYLKNQANSQAIKAIKAMRIALI